jgi:formiminotetrahydrofolate cyclodeaminase
MNDHPSHTMPSVPPIRSLAVGQLLDAFASSAPLPAGGSASALAGAVAVSLLLKVMQISLRGPSGPDGDRILSDAGDALRSRRAELIALVDRDTDAYANVIAAYGLPRTRAADTAHRRERIEAALGVATEPPLETLRACRQALGTAIAVTEIASRATRADADVAVELLLAAVRGAAGTVDGNLESMHDGPAVERVRAERARLETEGNDDGGRAHEALRVPRSKGR